MAEILLCNQSINSDKIESQCGVAGTDILGMRCGTNPERLIPYRPYLLSQAPSMQDRNILSQLDTGSHARNLTDLSLSLGEDNILALADISAILNQQQIGLMGASTSVYAGRVQGFGLAVQKYQNALLVYRDAIKADPARRVLARQKAFAAFKDMQIRFKHELAAVSSAARSKRGTPLSNPVRASNIARSSRNIAKLNITSQTQASKLVQFGKSAKLLGNGLAVIDFASRIGTVQNSYQSGGKWERDLFIESSSFALSAIAGTAAINTGLAVLMIATPVGWVGLIIGGAVVAGAAAGASIWTNNQIRENSGGVYDAIMKWMDLK